MLEEAEALELLKAAYDRGINTWDTAAMYSNGISEEIFGKAIKQFKIPREKVVILTKCYNHVGEEKDIMAPAFFDQMQQSKDYVNQGGESRPPLHRTASEGGDRRTFPMQDYLAPLSSNPSKRLSKDWGLPTSTSFKSTVTTPTPPSQRP